MDKLFGTDGIRAVAGHFPLDYPSIYTLSHALVRLLEEENLPSKMVIGKDTRESGTWIEQALVQGIKEAHGEAVLAGIIPTSAISYLTKKHSFSAGIVISASHNPYQDNGIKIFSSEGMKIPEAWEKKLENAVHQSRRDVQKARFDLPSSADLQQEYIEFLSSRFSRIKLPRLIKVALDCSNGASTEYAPVVFKNLGFEVISLGDYPDGKNINALCGSLHPQKLAKTVVENKADIGIAYDGDADRAIWVDETGRILNGDHTLYVLAQFMKERETLKSGYVVATTMSNLGLEKALERFGLKLYRTQVGDKYVLDQMLKLQANLGGEQSGHTIFLDDCPTGDGILTSIRMLEAMVDRNSSISELVRDFEEYPQILLNVNVSRKDDFHLYPEIMNAVDEIEKDLGQSGRFNLRYSGTEPLARIMIEGESQEQIETHARRLARIIQEKLGG